jgi:2-polyprenyl-3-methyl-5-hydroxy-6-metoxy-1,4-benzoquinol methylase
LGKEFSKSEWAFRKSDEDFYARTFGQLFDAVDLHGTSCRHNVDVAFTRIYDGPQKLRVLDYGCGIGVNGLMFAAQGHEVTLTDFESPKLLFARQLVEKSELDNVEVIPFGELDEEREWDLILCLLVMEHVKEPDLLLERLDSLLSPSGHIMLETDFAHYDIPLHYKSDSPRYYEVLNRLINERKIRAYIAYGQRDGN